MPTKLLSHADLGTVARLTPLVAIDLIIRNGREKCCSACATMSRQRAATSSPAVWS